MTRVQIYDKALCCSTGVCGPQVDPVLPRFAADLEWLQAQGHEVRRFNLAQDAGEFAKHPVVQKMLTDEGIECLPLVFVDDQVVSRGQYPTRASLALWTGSSSQPNKGLPLAAKSGCCGGDSGCC